jgi:hypothetical protein
LTNNGLLYLQPEYAIFTRSLAECNIHELIRQPIGVDKNEWIANNSSFSFILKKIRNKIMNFFCFISCGLF